MPSNVLEDYDSSSSDDSARTARGFPLTAVPLLASDPSRSEFSFPPPHPPSNDSSGSSSASTTPVPSRSPSPRQRTHFSIFQQASSSCTSETDSESPSPLFRSRPRSPWWQEDQRRWWSLSRRRRRRGHKFVRAIKRWLRHLVRHPLFPRQPITIVLTLILFSVFAILLTLLLIYILNPDKEPLPWRAYCSVPSTYYRVDQLPRLSSTPNSFLFPEDTQPRRSAFPPANFDSLPPVGVYIGIFSIDSAIERRMLVRTTWANHPRSRNGAGEGDQGKGTSRSVVRFVMGQPRQDWDRRIKMEMEMYNDIVILPTPENMNGGKTHTFFTWATINAWVPPLYDDHIPLPSAAYSNQTSPPPRLAPHDPQLARHDSSRPNPRSWVRPDFVVKVDDDAFVMIAELEGRLRAELYAESSPIGHLALRSEDLTNSVERSLIPRKPEDPMIYWGYLVTNRLHQFMAGELYALSWNLVDWVSKDPVVKTMTRGAEDKQTSKWMRVHPRASEIRWVGERCWMYDHPRSGTVYSHGFLFPSEVTRIKRTLGPQLDRHVPPVGHEELQGAVGVNIPAPSSWAQSSVSTFGVRYVPPVPELSAPYSVEALVEGSEMSTLKEGDPMTPQYAWEHREGRLKRYDGKRLGGTVVVHFIKKHMWFLETAIALLESGDFSEWELYQKEGGLLSA